MIVQGQALCDWFFFGRTERIIPIQRNCNEDGYEEVEEAWMGASPSIGGALAVRRSVLGH